MYERSWKMVMMAMVVFIIANASAADSEPLTDYQRLVKLLRAANGDLTRPVLVPNHTTTVNLALSPRWITLDDTNQLMTVEAWVFMRWKDAHLTWDPSQYGGITEVHLDSDDLWLPDVYLYNRVGGHQSPIFGKVTLLVKNSGHVMWFPPAHLTVPCVLDLTFWPRDQHNCSLSLGSWAHYGDQVDLRLMGVPGPQPGIIMSDLQKSAAWTVKEVTAVRNTQTIGDESHVDLEVAVVVRRRASERAGYLDSTMLVATLAVLLAYYVPLAQLHTRVLLHVLALLVLVVCYLVLYSTLPSYGGPVPLVVKWYRGGMSLSVLSLLCCLWLYHLAVVPYSRTIWYSLRRAFGSRKVVGTYDTLVEEQPQPDAAQAPPTTQAPPPSQLPHTANGAAASSPHTVVDVPSATETNFGGTVENNTSSDNSASLSTVENTIENTISAARAKRKAEVANGRARVANFLTGVFFTVTFLVDYIALRVTLGD